MKVIYAMLKELKEHVVVVVPQVFTCDNVNQN